MFSWFKKESYLLNKTIRDNIVAAIVKAERFTSAEIRIYVESHCAKTSALSRAEHLFEKLNMHQTIERNGILIYLALKDKKFAIAGDVGIHQKIEKADAYWQQRVQELIPFLKENKIEEGLIDCIEKLGQCLQQHFPAQRDNHLNELPNEIVFGK